MQKDTVINTISTVNLDPAGGTAAVAVKGIQEVILVLEDGTLIPIEEIAAIHSLSKAAERT